jgi:hypothetical protein
LKKLGHGNVLDCDKYSVSANLGIALSNIVTSFAKFKKAYYGVGSNFLLDSIFKNVQYGTGRGRHLKFDEAFFGPDISALHINVLQNIKWRDCVLNGSFVSFQEFEFKTGIPLNAEKYKKLKNCYLLLDKNHTNVGEPVLLDIFFRKIVRGSRWYRKILDEYSITKHSFEKMTQVKSYNKSTDTNFVNEDICRFNFSLWNIYSLPNRFKVFLFKYHNNLLGTGSRVSHFNPLADVACVFCTKNHIFPAPLESFSHVFFDCPII